MIGQMCKSQVKSKMKKKMWRRQGTKTDKPQYDEHVNHGWKGSQRTRSRQRTKRHIIHDMTDM